MSEGVYILSADEKKAAAKHLKMIKKEMKKGLIEAYYGWLLWHRITHKKWVTNTAILLFCDDDYETQIIALTYLDQMLERKGYKDAVILSDNFSESEISKYTTNARNIHFNKRKAEALLRYYRLNDFDDRFICVSLDRPDGRRGSSLIGANNTTKEEMVVIGILKLYPYRRRHVDARS